MQKGKVRRRGDCERGGTENKREEPGAWLREKRGPYSIDGGCEQR